MSMTVHWIALLAAVLIGGALDAALHESRNPYGLESLWKQGDFVTHGTLIFLLIMSMGSWYVAITKSVEHYRVMREAQAANATFWTGGSVRTGVPGLPGRSH